MVQTAKKGDEFWVEMVDRCSMLVNLFNCFIPDTIGLLQDD